MERTCPACRQPVPFEQVGEYCSVCGVKMSGPAGLPGGGGSRRGFADCGPTAAAANRWSACWVCIAVASVATVSLAIPAASVPSAGRKWRPLPVDQGAGDGAVLVVGANTLSWTGGKTSSPSQISTMSGSLLATSSLLRSTGITILPSG
jgi:hypothetical protein